MRSVAEEFRRLGLTPREGQVEAAESLARLVESSPRVVFVAPPGFGKTLAVLAALKALGALPATWRVRALSLAQRIADDVALLELKPETLLGRERVCPHAAKLGSDVHEWCRLTRGHCAFFRARTCPYFFHPEADIYIMNYLRRPPPRLIDVWDEAHNLLAPREVCLEEKQVLEAAAEAAAVDEELGRSIEELAPLPGVSTAVSVEPELLGRVYTAYARLLSGDRRRTALGGLYRVLSLPSVYVEEGKLCGARVLLPQSGVMVSATLPYAGRLGPVVEVPWARKLRAAIVSSVTTRYGEFGEGEARELRRLVLKLRKRAQRILVFATQRVARTLAPVADLYEPAEPPQDWRGVLLLHSRGRFSEGVDLRADVVVIAGAPYLPPHALAKLERVMQGTQGISDMTMLSTVLQCVGRATRTPEDSPLVVLADYRFERYAEELSKYFDFTELQL